MPNYETSTGRKLSLGPLLGAGGEGNVYLCSNDQTIAVKIYHKDKAAERYAKIRAITAAGSATGTYAAFPLEPVFEGVRFAGFTMPIASKRKPIHEAYSPSSRKTAFPNATFPFLLRVAVNTAIAFNKIHELGYVVGDVNHSGVLVSGDATVTFIDADSFQYKGPDGKLYPCKVGVPEYTPPELQGRDSFSNIERTRNHDNFGLAVLVFYLLFLGRHPFAGQVITGDHPTIPEAIRGFRFAYSSRHHETKMAPPPHSATAKDIPLDMADAFERAFGPRGVHGRPSALEWIKILQKAEGLLQPCTTSKAHDYFRIAKACPWCRIERSIPGFFCFNPVVDHTSGSTALTLKDLIGRFRAIPEPKAQTDLTLSLPVPNLMPNPDISNARIAAKRHQNIGLLISAAGAAGIVILSGPASTLCVVAIGFGALMYFGSANLNVTPFREAAEEAEKRWFLHRSSWQAQLDRTRYNQLKRLGDALIVTAESLPREEKQQIEDLHQQKKSAQLQKFLSGYRIDKAGLKSIGPSRLIALASRQIETAADIEYNRVRYIKGFGPNLAQELINWRQNLERKFHFNPGASIDPNEIVRVKAEISRKQAETLHKLRPIYDSLAAEVSVLNAKSSRAPPSTVSMWTAYKQAESDWQEAQLSHLPTSRGAFVLSILGPMLFSYVAIQPSSHSVSRPRVIDQQTANGGHQPVPPGTAINHPRTSDATSSPARQESPATNIVASEPIASAQVVPQVGPIRPGSASLPKSIPTQPLPPLTQVIINNTPASSAGEIEPQQLNTSEPSDAFAVQARLKDLGYLRGTPDGKFGPISQRALNAFQLAAGLSTGPMDAATARALFAPDAPKAAPLGTVLPSLLLGTWDRDPCGSPKRSAQVIITSDTATVYGGSCRFESINRYRDGWRGMATCTDGSKSWRSQVTLKLEGRVLSWTSARGDMQFFRCVPENVRQPSR